MAETLQRRTVGGRAFDSLNVLFLLLFTVTVVYPFWHLMIISFSGTDDIVTMGLHFWLDEWHIEAYRYVFSSNRVGRTYVNSILRVAIGTTTAIIVTLLAAYPLAKRDLPGRNAITTTFVFTMFVAGGLIPHYLRVRGLGLIDSRWALVLPVALDVFWVIIMRNFLMAIDVEMEEAAFMDGASVRTILVRILPYESLLQNPLQHQRCLSHDEGSSTPGLGHRFDLDFCRGGQFQQIRGRADSTLHAVAQPV